MENLKKNIESDALFCYINSYLVLKLARLSKRFVLFRRFLIHFHEVITSPYGVAVSREFPRYWMLIFSTLKNSTRSLYRIVHFALLYV